jgi:hypothetical protein
MCALTLRASQGVYYAVILVGVPGQYLVVGALVDILRGDSRSARTIRLLLLAALCTAGMLLWFLLGARPYPGGPSLTTTQFIALVAFHCTLAVALALEALRRWRERRAAVRGTAGSSVGK